MNLTSSNKELSKSIESHWASHSVQGSLAMADVTWFLCFVPSIWNFLHHKVNHVVLLQKRNCLWEKLETLRFGFFKSFWKITVKILYRWCILDADDTSKSAQFTFTGTYFCWEFSTEMGHPSLSLNRTTSQLRALGRSWMQSWLVLRIFKYR